MSKKVIQQLREQYGEKKREARNLIESKGSQTWTAEEQQKFDSLMDEVGRLDDQIEKYQNLLDDEAEKHFDDLTKGVKGRGEPGAENSARKGYDLFLRKSFKNQTEQDRVLISNAMSTTPDEQGGYTIEKVDVAGEVIDAIKAYGAMRKVASQISTSQGNPMAWPTSDGTDEEGELVGENQPAGSGDISFGTRALNVFKYGSKVITISMELLQDSAVDVVGLINKRFGQRIGRIHDRHFTVGTGTDQPMGLFTAAQVGKVGATGLSDTVDYYSLVDLSESLDVAYLDGSNTSVGWMFSQAMRKIVRKIKDQNGRPIWIPSYDAGATRGIPDELLGYAVHINNMAPAPAANAVSIAFGDLSAYRIRDALNIQIFRFEDSAYVSKGQIGFLAWARAGGNLMDPNAVKTFQHSAT